MADQQPDESQKTEEPTAKRLRDARQKGQVAVSREVNTWLALLGMMVIALFIAPIMMRDLTGLFTVFLSHAHQIPMDQHGFGQIMSQFVFDVIGALGITFFIFVALALTGGLVQNGVLFTPEPMKPKPDKLSLIKGAKRMFSMRQLVEALKGFMKIALIGVVGVILLMPEMNRLDILPSMHVGELLDEILVLVLKLLAAVLAIMVVVAVADLIFQRFQHRKQLRMTKQEVKEEFKNTEGDPQIKARLRQIRNERARERIAQAVPKADVVVTNPTHYAVALQYAPDEMEAPKLIAKGQDLIARRIREIAREHDIPVVENPPLARALYEAVEIDQMIPPEHYEAVAKVISYVFGLKGRKIPA